MGDKRSAKIEPIKPVGISNDNRRRQRCGYQADRPTKSLNVFVFILSRNECLRVPIRKPTKTTTK